MKISAQEASHISDRHGQGTMGVIAERPGRCPGLSLRSAQGRLLPIAMHKTMVCYGVLRTSYHMRFELPPMASLRLNSCQMISSLGI